MSILYPVTLLYEQILGYDFFVNPIYIPYIPDLANTIKALFVKQILL
jgi:hypothetical protein